MKFVRNRRCVQMGAGRIMEAALLGAGPMGAQIHWRIWRKIPGLQKLIDLYLEGCPEKAKDSIIFCCGKVIGGQFNGMQDE